MHAQFIGCIVTMGVDAPGVLERLIAKKPDGDVRVSDVDRRSMIPLAVIPEARSRGSVGVPRQ